MSDAVNDAVSDAVMDAVIDAVMDAVMDAVSDAVSAIHTHSWPTVSSSPLCLGTAITGHPTAVTALQFNPFPLRCATSTRAFRQPSTSPTLKSMSFTPTIRRSCSIFRNYKVKPLSAS